MKYSKQREMILKSCLKKIRESEVYDSILIDAPPTLGGWVIEQTGTFPKKFDSFEYKNLTIITNKITQKRVLDVKVVINPEKEPEEEN